MADSPKDDGPFRKTPASARDGLDPDAKSFLDVARMEAEGYTDEKLNAALGTWNATRLDALEAGGQGDDGEGLRRLVLGCSAVMVLLLGGLAIWAKTEFDKAAEVRQEIAGNLADATSAQTAAADTLAERLDSAETSSTARFEALEEAAKQQIVSADGTSARVVSGRSCGSDLSWKRYQEKDVSVDVNTAKAGFSETPIYTASVEGSGSWTTLGTHAIYSATPTGFRVYMFHVGGSDRLKYPVDKKWCISWLAVGK